MRHNPLGRALGEALFDVLVWFRIRVRRLYDFLWDAEHGVDQWLWPDDDLVSFAPCRPAPGVERKE